MADPNKSRSITQRGHVSSPGPDTSPLPRVAGDKERGKKGGEENFEQTLNSKASLLNIKVLRRRQNLEKTSTHFSKASMDGCQDRPAQHWLRSSRVVMVSYALVTGTNERKFMIYFMSTC